ncbi:MAG TPA: BTAD domain-containing putative transcriptional regulator [Gemmatimonadaceae bacterium]|nr:BTAD domain-containing putative transcriptional regulator [Gemmatimonadaceae bacterium]
MYHLKAFGGLSLSSDAAPLPAAATQRRRLAFLVLIAGAGERGITRDRLVFYLWPDGQPEKARHALEQLLYASRRDLGKDAFLPDNKCLRLNPDVIRSDVLEFEYAVERGDLERAASIYSGPFLDGVYLSDAPEFERWMEEERNRLEHRAAAALERLACQAVASGDRQASIEWWSRLAAADPLNARSALGLMNAFAIAGDRAGALRHAQVYETLVRQELEMEPDAEVVALAERLRRDPEPMEAVTGGALEIPAALEESGERRPAQPVEKARRQLPSRRISLRGALFASVLLVVLAGAWTFSQRQVASPAPASHSALAVLPFVDMSANGLDEYFSDGMTEELIHALSQVPGLRVVARTSAFSFKGAPADVRTIGEKLNVSSVLEGSVRRAGDRVRITVQLVDTKSGYHLWSETYDRQTTDIFAVQDEISRAVVTRLRPEAERHVMSGAPASAPNIDAYNLYLQGRYLANQKTPASLHQAVERFQGSIGRAPSYGPAYAGLADSYNALIAHTRAPTEQHAFLSNAEAAARRAIQLDPGLAEAHTALGNLLIHRWDWTGAELAFGRAIDANPGFATAYERYGILLALVGKFDEGVRALQRAQELDPLSLNIHGSTAYVLNLARRYAEAEPQARHLIAMDSTREAPHFRLGSVLLQMGRHDEAARAFQAAMRLSPSARQNSIPMLAYTYERGGRSEDAARLRPEIERGIKDKTISGYFAAAYFGATRETDRAFEVLDELAAQHESCLQDIAVDPVMDQLRSDPRFTRLINQVGLVDAGRR